MNKVQLHSLFTDFDISLFKTGKHYRLYEKMGSHVVTVDGVQGVYFAVWAPAAKSVHLIGDFNGWLHSDHQLYVRWDASGIWEGFLPGAQKGDCYKYRIQSYNHQQIFEKADPYARYGEVPPRTGSVVWDTAHTWKDKNWMDIRGEKNGFDQPFSIYELHLGSWKWHPEENRPLTFKELADELPAYIKDLGFTHVEFMPVMEHPYAPSWGYQITGFFAPTSRFGTPEDFKYLIDKLHQDDIAVILDWVPSHFPADGHGLGTFDGSSVYEHPDRRKGYHPDWQSLIFNYERNEVRSFLISNALFWLDQYHIDGLRVDAVASMIYLDYSREEGEWEPNEFGGRENLAAISFLKEFNEAVYASFPDIQTIAEESTAFPAVSKPTYVGGLGFGMKWMMGWMHDALEYFKKPPIYRRFHQGNITFSLIYAFTENFVLPLSHDEVVHGKASLLNKMPGDNWQKFANLRLLYSFMYGHPGAKLLFMGSELGPNIEWRFAESLEWFLLEHDSHCGIQQLIRELNFHYRNEPALHARSFEPDGFEWVDFYDEDQSVISFLRKSGLKGDEILVICNFTPVVRRDYRVGVPKSSSWIEIFNSDAENFWGSGVVNGDKIKVEKKACHRQKQSITLTLPPLAAVMLKPVRRNRAVKGNSK
jgi:1,4-alpha-glucan branching enzyme